MKPLISVIIPAYNCEETLEVAVRSILDQTYSPLEVIIVNDASSDETRNIADRLAKKDARVQVVDTTQDDGYRFDASLNRNVNAGYAARNTGFKYARGEYITFQDADDACFLNRLEVQYELLQKYHATHLGIDWIQYDSALVGKTFDAARYLKEAPGVLIAPKDLYSLSQKTKGLVGTYLPALNQAFPFRIKRMRVINKLFFGSLENYPGTGNSPLFRREVIEKVQFRPLKTRVWPSFMGRGADRDFNFQVAETFRNSYVVLIPLYLWQVPTANVRYTDAKSLSYTE
jgi:glycosyltransferase involved in cell wall biosynthesis